MTALVLTPRQAADRLGLELQTLRKHALTLEAMTGEALPRGEHLERLWPEALVTLLGEALGMVRRREAASVAGALGALYHPEAPLPAPVVAGGDELRLMIRDEIREVVREEIRSALASMPRELPGDELRLVVRSEVRSAVEEELERLRVLLHATAPASAPTPAPAVRPSAPWWARLLGLR